MLFNSFEYMIFLPIVFLLYWFVFDYLLKKSFLQLQLQNVFVVAASYVFYGWWDWRFLLLIVFTSLTSWFSGLLIRRSVHHSRLWLWCNVALNLGILALFKYYNFFVSEFCRLFGLSADGMVIGVLLPVGISFYTFQALSYSIDVYKHKIEPTHDIVAFFAYISFFPQLVAGPIERSTNLLPQFTRKRVFDYKVATDGMWQILWGLFKKIVIADNCAVFVDSVWAAPQAYTGSLVLWAAVLFALQIYCDFSGYSDIAIGTAKLFGISLKQNFATPYFSRDVAEFWRRWHISLTTWFRDYVYIPLGGSRPEVSPQSKRPELHKKLIILRNTLVIFLLSGLWHGANWTFLLWGLYHALLFIPLILMGKNRKYTNLVATQSDNGQLRFLPTWKELGQMALTFGLIVFGWIIFRSPDIHTAGVFVQTLFSESLFVFRIPIDKYYCLRLFVPVVIMFVAEWLGRNKQYALQNIAQILPNRWVRITIYALALVLVLIFRGKTAEFIYFQF
ncbi:MAG: MBOAT family protein [Paludibacteraceae bacterium]|nr:MBOAT family protein [Paludibacteraceae bacterium]